jgi:hypothetical protein
VTAWKQCAHRAGYERPELEPAPEQEDAKARRVLQALGEHSRPSIAEPVEPARGVAVVVVVGGSVSGARNGHRSSGSGV